MLDYLGVPVWIDSRLWIRQSMDQSWILLDTKQDTTPHREVISLKDTYLLKTLPN